VHPSSLSKEGNNLLLSVLIYGSIIVFLGVLGGSIIVLVSLGVHRRPSAAILEG
jgi:hypothetical protein